MYGSPVEPYSATVDYGDVSFTFGPASDADIALLERLVAGTHKHYEQNSTVTEILMEETEAYFNGEKTVDEVAELIENRVSTYVNENR